MMHDHPPVEIDSHELERANAFWTQFTQLVKISVIGVVTILALLALVFVR